MGVQPSLKSTGRPHEHDTSDYGRDRLTGEEKKTGEEGADSSDGRAAPTAAPRLPGPPCQPLDCLGRRPRVWTQRVRCGPSGLCGTGRVPAQFCCLCDHQVKQLSPHVCLRKMLFTPKASHTSDRTLTAEFSCY